MAPSLGSAILCTSRTPHCQALVQIQEPCPVRPMRPSFMLQSRPRQFGGAAPPMRRRLSNLQATAGACAGSWICTQTLSPSRRITRA